MNQISPYVLVLYYSNHGVTQSMANAIAKGIESTGMAARVRTVPEISLASVAAESACPEADLPDASARYCTMDDLKDCMGLALGSPTHFGNMAAPLKYFLDNTVTLWLGGNLQNKPACVFTTSGSTHGGQETTLLTMMMPLMHHGMIMIGLPYSEPALKRTIRGGSPYGASHISGMLHDQPICDDERELAIAQGRRLAISAAALAQANWKG